MSASETTVPLDTPYLPENCMLRRADGLLILAQVGRFLAMMRQMRRCL